MGCHIITAPADILKKLRSFGTKSAADLSLDGVKAFRADAIAPASRSSCRRVSTRQSERADSTPALTAGRRTISAKPPVLGCNYLTQNVFGASMVCGRQPSHAMLGRSVGLCLGVACQW
jgi:hypothetical protein